MSTPKPAPVPIPPVQPGDPRTLVLLFDGTGDTDDDDVSNVIELRNMLHPRDDPERQRVWYQQGIGTYKTHIPGTSFEVPLVSSVSQTLDGAIAWSLENHVVEGYEWIMNNYREGDKICLFGFSRGAYTARAVAAMINKVGLLPISQKKHAWDAYHSFSAEGPKTWSDSNAFRKAHESRQIIIEFVGVWDTVNSVGALRAKALSNTRKNGSVRTFRHAVALDEHRVRFRSNMWSAPNTDPKKQPWPLVTDVDQVWFAGGHCDVGGGSVPNTTRPNLAHIALRWMVRECFKTNNGMVFDRGQLAALGLDPAMLYPKVVTRPLALAVSPSHRISTDHILKPGVAQRAASWMLSWVRTPPKKSEGKTEKMISQPETEEERDLADALAPLYDQLEVNWQKWGALERVPLQMWDVETSSWKHRQNYKRGRTILRPEDPSRVDEAQARAAGRVPLDPRWAKVRVHRTVKTRMDCAGDTKGKKYVPIALLGGKETLDKVDPNLIEWVD